MNTRVNIPALRILGNIARGPNQVTDKILCDSRILPSLLHILKESDNVLLQKETAWTLSNIAGGSPQHV